MYQEGEEYEIHTKVPRRNKYTVKTCKIVQELDRFIVIQTKNYRDTVDKSQLKTGEVKLVKKISA